jgi:DNA end-binding protein Ku
MPRSLWTGAITFGLVNIPVKMFRATASASAKAVGFHQIHEPCGTRIKHLRWCPKDEKEVPWEEVAKGYEVSKGRYVIMNEEDLDKLLPEDDYAAVAIENFVALDEVDPMYFDRAYYLSPDGNPKAYTLLHHALQDSGRVAIARVTLRTRSHLSIVRAQEGHLLMSTMFFADEIVDASEIPGLPQGKAATVDKRQAEAAAQLIDSMTVAWDPTQYTDEYTEKVEQVIEAKVSSGEITETLALPEEGGGKVVNLLDALKKSVAAAKKGESHPPSYEIKPVAPRRHKRERSTTHAKRRPSKRHAS